MSSFGEHSGTLERTRIRTGKLENYTKSQGRLSEPANWLFGKELSIKDINICPVKQQNASKVRIDDSTIEDNMDLILTSTQTEDIKRTTRREESDQLILDTMREHFKKKQ